MIPQKKHDAINEVWAIESKLELIIKYESLLSRESYQDWTANQLFTPHWWILLGLFILPWSTWYLLVNKKRILEILVYSALISGMVSLFDEVGSTLTLWAYPIKLIPFLPLFIPMCYSLVPVVYSLIYQFFPEWNNYIYACTVTTAVFVLIILPLATRYRFLVLLNWEYIYTAPVFMFGAFLSKAIIQSVNTVESRSGK